jgi:hypothetical protein
MIIRCTFIVGFLLLFCISATAQTVLDTSMTTRENSRVLQQEIVIKASAKTLWELSRAVVAKRLSHLT